VTPFGLRLLLLALLVCVAAWSDLRHRRFSLLLPGAFAGAFLAIHGVESGLGNEDAGLLSALLGGALAFGLMAPFAWAKRLGFGDAALLGSVGAGFGFPKVLSALLLTSVAGAVLSVVALVASQRQWPVARFLLRPSPSSQKGVPYAVAIALGSLGAMWFSN
jgi:Flp pilus assembly protein protease CpaA